MTSPVDSFKTNLFGQLKSYSNAVQGVFEQRIARPLLAFKRDLSRPTSETRAHNDQESISSVRQRQESSSSSSPLEIIDIDSTNSFKTIFNKVRHSLSPSINRRTSENPVHDHRPNNSTKENRHSSLCPTSNSKSHKRNLSQKSVSFAENIESDYDSDNNNSYYSIDDQNEIIRNAHTLADQILIAGINATVAKTASTKPLLNRNEDDFEDDFFQTIKPRRLSINNTEDLVYQDLSAEIVSYVLKHALRTLKKEQEYLSISKKNEMMIDQTKVDDLSIPISHEITTNQTETHNLCIANTNGPTTNQNEQDEDFIDLK